MSAGKSHTRVVVPLRSFNTSKRRLAGVLDGHQRATLARIMAQGVVEAADDYAVAVACDDDGVAAWALSVGAEVIRTDGHDLNSSVRTALIDSHERGWERMAIAHADLPLVTSFTHVLDPVLDPPSRTDRSSGPISSRHTSRPSTGPIPGEARNGGADEVVIVPDRHSDGTNLMVVPCNSDFRFAYGPGSFRLHTMAAIEAGMAVTVIEDSAFSWDVDEPEDLQIRPAGRSQSATLRRLVARGLLTITRESNRSIESHETAGERS